MNRPWMKFYPADWRADPRLRMCSLAARGLWADLISYMHEGEPYGHLTIDGRAPDERGIAALVARPLSEVRKAISELGLNNVFSRTSDGIIFSRRMVRDKAKDKRDQQNGKGGGNPKLVATDKGGVNPPVKGGDKAHILEARDQKERKEDTADAVSTSTGNYAFESGIIRLSQGDFDKWKIAFSYLDLAAELVGLTQWAGEQGPEKWFFAVSGVLAKRNREAKFRLEQNKAAAAGEGLTNDEKYWGKGRTPGIM